MPFVAGQSANFYGTRWTIDAVLREENAAFTWLRIAAHWSGLGPRPLWADEPRIFLRSRRFKATGLVVISE
jgi:hypothetical protein